MRPDKAHHGLLVNRNDHARAAGLWVLGAPLASAATGVASKRPMPGRLQLCDIRKAPRAPFFLIVAAVSGIRFLCAENTAPWWATNVRVGWEGAAGGMRLGPFVGINNAFNHQYVSSVVINAARGRYYEPAPGRNVYLGISIGAGR